MSVIVSVLLISNIKISWPTSNIYCNIDHFGCNISFDIFDNLQRQTL